MSKYSIFGMDSSVCFKIGGTALSFCAISTSIYALKEFISKNHWANNKLFSYSDSSIRENYTIENMIDRKEILICVTKKELEAMDEQEKTNFFNRFTYRENNLIEKVFKDCVENGKSVYLSCIPNVGDDTLYINDVFESFEELDGWKSHLKFATFAQRSMIAFLILGCSFISFNLGKTKQ